MYESTERCIESILTTVSEIEGDLDLILDYAMARLIVCVGIAMLIVTFK